jgi:hypothetical protein
MVSAILIKPLPSGRIIQVSPLPVPESSLTKISPSGNDWPPNAVGAVQSTLSASPNKPSVSLVWFWILALMHRWAFGVVVGCVVALEPVCGRD